MKEITVGKYTNHEMKEVPYIRFYDHYLQIADTYTDHVIDGILDNTNLTVEAAKFIVDNLKSGQSIVLTYVRRGDDDE